MALHPETLSLQLPVAVIYPSVHPTYYSRSTCLQSNLEIKTGKLAPFLFLYVGRLASEKSPGLLLRALANILQFDKSSENEHRCSTLLARNQMFGYFADVLQFVGNSSQPISLLGDASDSEDECFQHLLFQSSVRLDFYGDGELAPYLVELAQSFHLISPLSGMGTWVDSDKVRFYGGASREVLARVMSQADFLVNPRAEGETFGFVHVEAAVSGLPVIAFARGAFLETIVAGIVIHDLNATTIVQSLSYSLAQSWMGRRSNLFLQKDLCLAGEKMISALSAESHADQVVDLVEAVEEAIGINK